MAFRWRAYDHPLVVVFGSSISSSTKKNIAKVGPSLTKLLDQCMQKLDQIRWSSPSQIPTLPPCTEMHMCTHTHQDMP